MFPALQIIKKSILITLTLLVMLIMAKNSRAEVDCNSVTGGPPGLTGTVPISFTFISLNEFSEEPHGKVILFYEESVWELGGDFSGYITIFMSVAVGENGNIIAHAKTIGTDVEYQGLFGGISGTFRGLHNSSTGGYKEYDIWKGEGSLSDLLIKIYVPPQEESTTPSGDLIIWGCATIN